jgi:DNA-binding SARP family transcriptional activator/TolB-like protein
MTNGLQAVLVDPPIVKAQSRCRESGPAVPLPQNEQPSRAATRESVNMGVSGGIQRAAVQRGGAPLEIHMFGPLRLSRRGRPVALPPSRKVRALLAYLALAPKPVARGPLCELLWDVPNDPRGELRWCLSKIRGLLDDRACRRVHTHGDTVQLDLSQCLVDVLDVLRAAEAGIETRSPELLGALAASFEGEFLESLAIGGSPVFTAWLTAQRRRLRSCRTAVLEQLVMRGPDDQAVVYLDTWLELAPFDQRAHECLFKALARRGKIREAEAHLTTTIGLFEREGLESTSVRTAWRAARTATGMTIQEPNEPGADTAGRGRAAIAIMPFIDRSSAPQSRGGAADALADDVITRLAKLRSLFVIAQGTVFALHERGVGAEEAGRLLNVDYVVSGSTRVRGTRLTVTVELAETRSARIVWTEIFNLTLDDAFVVLDEIGNRIVASIASEIEALERNRAILKPPSSLDAWGAHHRGLWHMHQYRQADNEHARHFFETALRLDPTFSRAYAGLSFTHFHDAFQNWSDRAAGMEQAYRAAAQGLMADERDPAVHWAMGRALMLRGQPDESISALTRSIELSPNFALGHYNLSFVHSIVGDARAAIDAADYSRHLSPFDPMLYGMLATRAMALVRLGRFEEAASWAVKAAARPNVFPHIHAIAACCLALAGSREQARAHVVAVRHTSPRYRLADFFTAFPFDRDGQTLFRRGARLVGLT